MNESDQCPKCGQPVPPGAPEGLCPRCLGALNLDSETGIPGAGAAAAAPPPSAAELAPHFPQLEILELLGRGGMGVVYKVRQKELDRISALKILPPGIGGDPAFAERFAREAKALARLNHPGIVTIYDSGRTDGLYYFLMEFVDGVSLGRLMRGTRVSPREALAIVPQICDALQYAHDQGIVHRDIKPENILLDRQGRVKVADFGLAKLMAGTQQPLTPSLSPSGGERVTGRLGEGRQPPALTDAGKILGTPAYMAPEQAEHPAEVDHRADIYALGVVFYQMLTGELPGKRIEPPSKKVQIDVRLDEVVLRALERQPERRYQNASELRTVVETVVAETMKLAAAGGAPGTAPGSVPQGATALTARHWSRAAIAGAAGIGFFLFVQVLWFLGWPPSSDPSFGRTLPQLVFYKAVLPGAFAALLASTILGWTAVARIRRSAGRLRGLGLAAFDGLFLPLLTVDLVILVAWAIAIKVLAAHRGLGGSMFRNLWDFTGFVLLLGLVAGWVDYLLLKPVWRVIAGSAGGEDSSTAPRRGRRLVLLAAALGLVVTILYPAYVMLGENSRKARYGWSVEAGTELHYQVFEADAAVVDRLVPFALREPGNAISSAGTYTLRPSYTAVAQMAEINRPVLAALLESAATNSGLLASATKKGENLYQWRPDAWSYTNALARGKGEGFCGMGRDLRSVRFRLRYQVSHTVSGNAGYPVTAEISYEGQIPPAGKARAFFIPFGRNEQAKYLVIAFEAKANPKDLAWPPSRPAQSSHGSAVEPPAATNGAAVEANAPTNPPPASPPTVEQILARYAEAKGEMAGPDKTRTLVLKGRFTSRDSLGTHDAEALIEAPDKWLLSLQDTNGPIWRRAFDGSAAWEIAQWGSPEVDPAILLSVRVIISLYRGDSLTPFVTNMSLKGKQPIGGEQAYVVAVALPSLAPRLWFDTQSGLLVRIEYDVAGSVMQMDFGDYRDIGGLMVPFNIREAGTESWTIQCSEVKRNEPIADSAFKRPASQ